MATLTTIVQGKVGDGFYSEANVVTDEHWTSSLGAWVNVAYQNLSASSVLVRTTDNLTTYMLGTDYQMDYVRGLIKALSGGTMADATAYHISYVYPAGGLAEKVNAVTTVAQAAAKAYKVVYAFDGGYGVAVIVTQL